VKLLILTQAVDRTNPILGFMHRWIQALAQKCDSVVVVCLKKGTYTLPSNVRVLSLGKEEGVGKFTYVTRFFLYLWSERNNYDAVFVHMNQEYVLIGGLLWRLLGKRIVLWRNHKKGSILTRIAVALSHAVTCTSPDSYTKRFSKTVLMPVGIDTDFFVPGKPPEKNTILFFGRLDPVKRVHIFVEALVRLKARGVMFCATICGDPSIGSESYGEEVRSFGKKLVEDGSLIFRPSIPQAQAPQLFQSHAVYVNLTPSGSFDKTILEAAASGCIPVVENNVLHAIVPGELHAGTHVDGALIHALSLNDERRKALQDRLRVYVVSEHSLNLLINRILAVCSNVKK